MGSPAGDRLQADGATDRALGVRLAEYAALKNEQAARIERRDHLIYVNLTAIAAGLVAADKTAVALLVLPLVSAVLGWTHLSNDRKITAVADYLSGHLGVQLARLADGAGLDWEVVNRAAPDSLRRHVIQAVVDVTTFGGPAVVSLAAYAVLTRPGAVAWLAIVGQLAAVGVLVWQQTTAAAAAIRAASTPRVGGGCGR